jgi:hypothetical protein
MVAQAEMLLDLVVVVEEEVLAPAILLVLWQVMAGMAHPEL